MPNEGPAAQRRRLVFTNLVNGVRMPDVMAAFKLSEKEVLADYAFVARKIGSYRFERILPILKCDTPAEARQQIVGVFWTLARCNLDVLPHHGLIETLPLNPEAGHISPAEERLLDMRLRAASR